MNFNFLPETLYSALSLINLSYLYEMRLRVDYPVKVNYKNKIYYLSKAGLTKKNNKAIICNINDVEHIIGVVTERSLYAYNDRIKEGYLTTKDGIRIGLCGECVFDGGQIITIKNLTSLNIRIPHEIYNCSKVIFNTIYKNKNVNSTLIIAPPFLGKTTILKDILRKLNDKNKYSILVIDERGEFSSIKGENIDNIKYSNKSYAFNYGVRSLSPNVVITDELANEQDWLCAKNAICSGVKIIASCHCDNINKLMKKSNFINNIFDYYVVLKSNGKFGQVDKIFDSELNLI